MILSRTEFTVAFSCSTWGGRRKGLFSPEPRRNPNDMYEYEIFSLVLLFFAGVAGGVIAVMAGGGASVILPTLICLGIDPTVANGTTRVAILFQNSSAIVSFRKQGFSELRTGLKLALLTLPGVLAGALVAVRVGDRLFEEILAVVLVFVCASFFLKPDSLGRLLGGAGQKKWILYPAMIAIGFYGGFVQVGAGFLIMAVLYHVMGDPLVRVNFHKVIVILLYTVPAVLIFFLSGNVNLFVGICLAVGTSVGGWLGAAFSVRGGERYIRFVLVLAVVVMAVMEFEILTGMGSCG